MSALVTEAIGDSISLPVKHLLRTTHDHAGRKTLTLTISCSHVPRQALTPKSLAVLRTATSVGPQGGLAQRNPPFTDDQEAGYAGAGHRAAPCADPLG
jgi:hypothetical protein